LIAVSGAILHIARACYANNCIAEEATPDVGVDEVVEVFVEDNYKAD